MPVRSLEDGRALEDAIEIVRAGGVVAFPTDTVYGFGASLTEPNAMSRIFTIKGRPEVKPLPILVARPDVIPSLSSDPDEHMIRFARSFWPGPLTIVLRARPGLPREVLAADGTVGVRVPNHSVPLAIAQGNGGAIASTSANRSGHPPACNADEIEPELVERLDVVLDGGFAPCSRASTVVRRDGDDLTILREGFVTSDALAKAWEDIVPRGRITAMTAT